MFQSSNSQITTDVPSCKMTNVGWFLTFMMNLGFWLLKKKIRMIFIPHKNGTPSQVLGLDVEKN
jgi:hypothetical protein